MQTIILISGFGGSGKSTCAQLLWDQLERVAIVEADHLFRIKPFEMQTREGREQIGRIKLQNSVAVLETFLAEGFTHIIVEGLVWSQAELDIIADLGEKRGHRVFCVWLSTSRAVRHARAIARGRDEADSQEFLDQVERTIVDPTPLSLPRGHYHEIQTDALDPQDIVEEILRLLAQV